MAVAEFIRAMPKVELHVRLAGAMNKARLLHIAEQNEIASELKGFERWVQLLDEPDFSRLADVEEAISHWVQHPDDLAHVIYELGVSLAKQHVRYAEVHVNPIFFIENNWSFESLLKALNDGRDRAERGWQVQMRWVLIIDRSQPRHADEIVRWASSATGQNGGIVGIDLDGPEDAQPVGQFERAFRTAASKNVPSSVHAGEQLGAKGILEILDELAPDRIVSGWGTAESADVITKLTDTNIPLVICLTQALKQGWIDDYADYPLRSLYDDDVAIVLSSAMPSFYGNSLTDEYLSVVESCGLSLDELETVALNAVHTSRLPAEEKAVMIDEFKQAYDQLREEHMAEAEEDTP